MEYVFGPVPSRRLGQSLGVDTIPLKTCNWNCIYCQLGRSRPMTNERRAYYPREAILAEVEQALAAHEPGTVDWITFVGSGEPTLHLDLGWLIGRVKALTDLPVAVCTNGALLSRPEVRAELVAADAVTPTVAAGSAALYRLIHRPLYELTFDRFVAGLIAFRDAYSGQLWPEVMLLGGINDCEAALNDIGAVLDRIRPDEVHLSLPVRPPAETWVRPPDAEGVMRALALLGRRAGVIHPVQGTVDLNTGVDLADAIADVITRHPISQGDLERALAGRPAAEVEAALAELAASGRAQIVERYRVRFWTATAAYYPDAAGSEVVSPEALRRRFYPHEKQAGGPHG